MHYFVLLFQVQCGTRFPAPLPSDNSSVITVLLVKKKNERKSNNKPIKIEKLHCFYPAARLDLFTILL